MVGAIAGRWKTGRSCAATGSVRACLSGPMAMRAMVETGTFFDCRMDPVPEAPTKPLTRMLFARPLQVFPSGPLPR